MTVAGSFWEAAVEGFRSWAGDGWRLREADWRVEAISMAGLDAIVLCVVIKNLIVKLIHGEVAGGRMRALMH